MGDQTTVLGEPVVQIRDPFISLEMVLFKTTLPASVISGEYTESKVMLEIYNRGNIPVPADRIDPIEIYLRPVGEGDDIFLREERCSLKKLTPGKRKKLTLSVIFEEDIPEGQYYVALVCDGKELVIDSPVRVADPFIALTMTLDKCDMPPAIIAGQYNKEYIILGITNEGNICTAKDQTAMIDILARPADGNDVPLESIECSIKNLKPGKCKKIKLPVLFGETIPENDYTVVFVCDANELAAVSSITVKKPFIALQMNLLNASVPSSVVAGQATKAMITVDVCNIGNICTSRTYAAIMNLTLCSLEGGNDVAIEQKQCAFGNLRPGKSKRLKLPILFDSNIPEGDYSVVLSCDGNDLTAVPMINVADPFILFYAKNADFTVPDVVVAGTDVAANVRVEISNKGNVSSSRDATTLVKVLGRPSGGGDDVLLASNTYPIGALAPEKTKTYTLPLTFPAKIPEGTYGIVIHVDDQEQLLLNAPSVDIVEPSIDLAGSMAGAIPPTLGIIGNSSDLGFSLTIQNNGTTPTSSSQTIAVAVYGRQAAEPDVLLGELTGYNISNLAGGQGKQYSFSVPITISEELESGSYGIIVQIDSQDVISEENEADNWISLGTVNVEVIDSVMDIVVNTEQDYDTVVTGDFYRGSGSGTASVSSGYEYIEFDDGDYGHQEYGWENESDGWHLTEYYWPAASGYEYYRFDFDTLVMPRDFQLHHEYHNQSPASGRHRIWGNTIDLTGTAETVCEILGLENITVNGVQYQAFKISFSLIINSTGQLDLRPYGDKLYNVTSKFDQDITWWAVPGIGVVKSKITYDYKITYSGAGYDLFRSTENRTLKE
jgi:hypothetical protein